MIAILHMCNILYFYFSEILKNKNTNRSTTTMTSADIIIAQEQDIIRVL